MSRRTDIIDLTKLKPNSDNSPLVSVIVPSYNVEEYIDQCLTSILNNGYRNIELLVIDDRSTDGTVDHIVRVKYIIIKGTLGLTTQRESMSTSAILTTTFSLD